MKSEFSTFRRPRRLKWPRRIAIVLIVYTILGFFVLPAIIKSQILKRLPALTHRQTAVKQVKLNPYALSLTIRGFSLKEASGEDFVSFDEFYANFQLSSLFKRAWVFKEISLTQPFAQVTYREDGTFNFADLLTNAAPATTQPKPPPRIQIGRLSITNGVVACADLKRKTPFHTQFIPIQLNLTGFTTQPEQNNPYSFTASDDEGESLSWSGNFSLTPLRSSGSFKLTGLVLKKYSSYAQDFARFNIVDGKLDVKADYFYDSATNALDAKIYRGAVDLTNLQLKDPDTSELVVNVPSFSVRQVTASVVQKSANVGSVKSTGGSILVRQNQDGTINLLSLLNVPAQESVTNSAPPAEGAPWTAKIEEIAFENYAIKVEDKKTAVPASLSVDHLALTLKNVSNVTNAPFSASISFNFHEIGSVNLDVTATLFPLAADAQISVTNLDLRPLQPYVNEQAKLVITSGTLNTHGHAGYLVSESNTPLMNFTGDLAINNFATTDDVLFKDFTKWDSLTVDGIKMELQPMKLVVDQVKFAGLKSSLIVGPDHRSNLETILRSKALATNEMPATATAPPQQAKNLNISLATLAFENASINFSDQSLDPHCNFAVQEFSGTIKGLSSQDQTTATVDVSGKVDDRAPFTVTGKVNPLASDLFVDVAVAFKNTELTPFTPYMEKFAGYPLQKGKLSFDVRYSVAKRELKGQNGVHIDQLTLGAKNNSPDATHLPVKLAIALLKDRNGKIDLDVPVSGKLDDPKFKLGGVILHVFVNILTKAATSPFSLLGAMFGGGEELSFVTFEPGRADLAESETKKLDTLAKALFERPALSLEIAGSVDPTKEREALAHVRLDQQIKSLRAKELSDVGQSVVNVDSLKLETKDRERLLKQIYKKTFGRYKPSPPPGSGTTNTTPAIAVGKAEDTTRGASLLMVTGQQKTLSSKTTQAQAQPGQPKRTRAESELADMEDQLVQKAEITENDFRELMQKRANQVQAYLLKTEKVAAERLFVIAPKPGDTSFKGESRVNLSLN